jgi:hypothetical protein
MLGGQLRNRAERRTTQRQHKTQTSRSGAISAPRNAHERIDCFSPIARLLLAQAQRNPADWRVPVIPSSPSGGAGEGGVCLF